MFPGLQSEYKFHYRKNTIFPNLWYKSGSVLKNGIIFIFFLLKVFYKIFVLGFMTNSKPIDGVFTRTGEADYIIEENVHFERDITIITKNIYEKI